MTYNDRETIDALVNARFSSSEPEWYSELIARLYWITDPEKLNITEILKAWLVEGNDEYKIRIVLNLEEFFLFKEVRELEKVLTNVSAKFPSLQDDCTRYLDGFEEATKRK